MGATAPHCRPAQRAHRRARGRERSPHHGRHPQPGSSLIRRPGSEEADDLSGFLTLSRAYLGYYPEQFPTDGDKVGFIASRLEGTRASVVPAHHGRPR